MEEITIKLTKREAEKVRACLMYFSKDYEIMKFKHEINYGQDDDWQDLRDLVEYYHKLAEKFKTGGNR